MSETKTVNLKLKDGSIQECSIEFIQVPPWSLKLSGLQLPNNEFKEDDLFDSLTALRRELETIGARLLCAGSRPDVYPSGMSRSMGGGRKAYIHRVGRSATDLIDIFDPADEECVGTVEEQIFFRERWKEHFRRP